MKKTLKIISLVLSILLIMSVASLGAVAANKLYISFVSAVRYSKTSVTVFYWGPQNTYDTITLMVLNDKKSTKPDDILYIGEREIIGNGYQVFDINFPEGKLDENKDYYIATGNGISGVTYHKFSGAITDNVSKSIGIEPNTYSDMLYGGLPFSAVVKVTTVGGTEMNAEDYTDALITGMKYRVKLKNSVEFNFNLVVQGDYNNDNAVNSVDALMALQTSVGKIEASPLKKIEIDMDFNGTINSVDSLRILQYSVGKASIF